MFFNKTYTLANTNLANGYWTNFNMTFNFATRNFTFILNGTFAETIPILNDFSVSSNVDREVFTYELLFNFYFNVQFYLGGYDVSLIPTILKELERQYVQLYTRATFKPLFEQLLSLEKSLYWSGCLRNVRVNSFLVVFDDSNNLVNYKNVRFDGCPAASLITKLNSSNLDLDSFKVVYQGQNTTAFDTQFNSFTEYFYRVVASNSQGESASEWLLIRTPEDEPSFNVDISLLEATALSGYQIEIAHMRRFCVYCEIYLYQSEAVFTGIVVKFELLVEAVTVDNDVTGNLSRSQTFEFYCLQSCNVIDDEPSNNGFINILNDPRDPRLDSFLVDVTPITTYTMKIRVCNSFKCTSSEG